METGILKRTKITVALNRKDIKNALFCFTNVFTREYASSLLINTELVLFCSKGIKQDVGKSQQSSLKYNKSDRKSQIDGFLII